MPSLTPPPPDRARHLEWLLELTQIPTAAGRERRVVEWIRRWVHERPELVVREDAAGNLVVEPSKPWSGGRRVKGKRRPERPIFVTAHLDHPAFVVHRVIAPGTLELAFRGGVMDAYFEGARVVVHAGGADRPFPATLAGPGPGVAGPDGQLLFKTYLAELDDRADAEASDDGVRIGDVATWALPPAEVDRDGLVHTAACDDLAAAAAALAAYDTLLAARRSAGAGPTEDVRLLFTRSEEIGFTGAIAACRLGTMPKAARVVALENSRAFPESPIGGGPIVRVGDRLSVFSPRLTASCAKRAEEVFAAAAAPTATQRQADLSGRRWQRKLMAGGACEATVFCAYGYEATCLCLPLGNYHNMADLAAVQDGSYDAKRHGPPKIAREFIHRDDFHGLVDLLVAIGTELPDEDPAMPRIEKLFARCEGVLLEEAPKPARAAPRSPSREAAPAAKRDKPSSPSRRKKPAAKKAPTRRAAGR